MSSDSSEKPGATGINGRRNFLTSGAAAAAAVAAAGIATHAAAAPAINPYADPAKPMLPPSSPRATATSRR